MSVEPGYIFGPGTGVPTYEELKRRRAAAVAQAMQKQRAAPKNIGEGIFSVGESIADVMNERRLNDAERQLEAKNTAEVDRVLAGGATPAPYPGLGAGAGLPGTGTTAEATPAPDYRARIAAVMTPGGGAPPANPTGAASTIAMSAPLVGLDDPADEARWNARARAIGGIESGGRGDPYAALGATTPRGDRAYGRYQVMGANIPQWSQAALGASLTPEQFLASKEAQDDVFRHRFGGYVDKYGDEGAARAWYGGEKGMKNLGATDQHGRLTVGNYGQQYMNALGGPRGAPTAALPPSGTATDAPPIGVPRVPGMEENPVTESAIRPAPPADPIRVAGPATAAVPPAAAPAADEYVRPKPVPPKTIERTPEHPQEKAARWALAKMPGGEDHPQRRMLTAIIKEHEDKRAFQDAREITRYNKEMESYTNDVKEYRAWEAGRGKAREETEERRLKLEAQRRTEDTAKRLGGVPESEVLSALKDSQKEVKNIPGATASLRGIQQALDKGQMFTGATAEFDLAKAKAWAALGGEANPKIVQTEKFKALISTITAQARQMLAGGANISDKDLEKAETAAGGNIKLEAGSIKEILAAAERLNAQMAVAHHRKVKTYAGDDPARQAAAYGVYEVPGMDQVIPQPAVNDLRRLINAEPANRAAIMKEFDDDFHTPGLAARILGGRR